MPHNQHIPRLASLKKASLHHLPLNRPASHQEPQRDHNCQRYHQARNRVLLHHIQRPAQHKPRRQSSLNGKPLLIQSATHILRPVQPEKPRKNHQVHAENQKVNDGDQWSRSFQVAENHILGGHHHRIQANPKRNKPGKQSAQKVQHRPDHNRERRPGEQAHPFLHASAMASLARDGRLLQIIESRHFPGCRSRAVRCAMSSMAEILCPTSLLLANTFLSSVRG